MEAAGPADLQRFDLGGAANAEVQAEIALRNVAAAAADFPDLMMAVDAQGYASADGVAIGLCADELDGDPVSLGRIVFQEAGSVVTIVHKELDASVVAKICGGEAVAVEWFSNGGAGV